MEAVPGFGVSSNRLDEPGIELGTPGYKTSGLSTTPRLLLLFCVFILLFASINFKIRKSV